MLRPYVFPCRFSGRMTDLKRSLRLTDGLAMVVGMTVGAGIFRTPGIVAARLGRPGLTFVVWVLGAGLAFLGALCFAELTTRQPRAAGKYAFVREAFGTRAGFVVGWVEALGTNGVAIAAIGVAGGEFLVRLLGWPPARIAPLGAGLVALFTGINLVGVASGRWVQNVVTAAKLLALGGVVVIAFARGTGAGWHGALPGAPVGLGVWVAIALAAHPVIWTYYGYPDLAKIAGEVVDPSRTLPRILLGALAATGTFELLLGLAIVQVLVIGSWAVIGLFRLRGRDGPAPFSVPGYPWLPLLFVAVYAALFAGTVRAQPALVAGALAMLGVAYALSWIVKTDRAAPVAE